MNRYLISFTLTSLLYFFLIFTLFFYFPKPIAFKKEPKESTVKLKIIEPQPVAKPKLKPKVVPKSEPKPKPKPTPKQKPKLKPIPKPNPIPVFKPNPKLETKSIQKTKPAIIHPQKKHIIKKPQKAIKEHISKPIVKKSSNKTIRQDQQKENIKNQKRLRFIKKLKERINENKFYPNRAIKLNIEGSVSIEFMLNKDGSITDIDLLEGSRVFRNSAYKAIKDSSPIHVEAGLFDFPKKFTITLVYNLQ